MCITGTGNGTARGLYGNMDVVTAVLHIIRGQLALKKTLVYHL